MSKLEMLFRNAIEIRHKFNCTMKEALWLAKLWEGWQ